MPTVEHDMTGKSVLITGANSGIGRAIAMGMARLNAHVIMVCRNPKRGERAQRDIVKRTGNKHVDLLIADLSTRDAIRSLASKVNSTYNHLEVLVNNAGVVMGKRKLTSEGFETTFFVNHLSYFLLTNLLLDLIKKSEPARIVNIASSAHSRGAIDFENLQLERDYAAWHAYANSKLMNVMFTYSLARRLAGTNVTVNCVHPGVIHTNLLSNFNVVVNLLFHALQKFFKNPEEGAQTPLYVATSPEVTQTGQYFRNLSTMGTGGQSNDESMQERLWAISAEMTDL